MASKGSARIILEQPQKMKQSGEVDPMIPKFRDFVGDGYSYRKLRHGWTRLVALCKMLDKQQVEWDVHYDLNETPPTAMLTWRTW